MSWEVKLTKRAAGDLRKLQEHGGTPLEKAKEYKNLVGRNPFENPPPYKRLKGDLKGFLSRRLDRAHRFVYKADKDDKVVMVRSMWGHYDD